MIWQSQNVAGARGNFEDSHVRLGANAGDLRVLQQPAWPKTHTDADGP